MSRTLFPWRRLVSKKGSPAKGRPQRYPPQVEQLEDRVVPSYFPSTANGIHIFEDQVPDNLSNTQVQFLATHTDGTQKETLSTINQFRAINPNYTLLHYQLGTGNSAYNYIINDQWASDFSYVNQQESWFAHQTYSGEPQSAADLASGRVLGNNNDWYQADIANPAWQQYTLGQVFQNMAATGSNGWFADSYTYGIGGGGYDSPIPTRYQGTNAANPADWPGGITWTTQLGNWAQTIENAFAQHNATYGTNYVFIPNLDNRTTSWEPNWYDNANGVPFIDGAFLEGFGEATDTYNWTLSMNRGLNLTDNGKIVIMQPYPSASPSTAAGQQQVDFFLGTYLLLKGDQTYLNIKYGSGAQYFPEYGLNLGAATTPLPSNVSSYLWNGVYRRDFQNGFVLVNPGTTTYTLNLGGTYQQVIASGGGPLSDSQIDANGNYIGGSLSYQNVTSITLAGGSAAIFLNPSGSGSLTVATPAQAAANPVTGTSVGLSVLGAENGSDSGLTYTWSSSGPAAVTFSVKGTNAAKNTVATFAHAGAYTFTATISDGSQSVTSTVTVTVNQTLTSLQVSPATATVRDGATQQFSATALDQFGISLATQPAITWSLATGGLGTISTSGLYTAPTSGVGSATIQASSGAASASATVSVVAVPTVVSETPAPGATGVATGTVVTATFNESVVASTISFVLKDSNGNVVSAALAYNGSTHTATLTPSAALNPKTTYTATVSGAQDQAGDAMAGSVTWSFTTAKQWKQTTAADFSAGTQSGTFVTNTSGGEVQLAPAFEDDFNGSALSSAWTTTSWTSSGSATLSGGVISLAGMAISSVQTFSNTPVEGRVDFGAATYQHFGMATGLSSAVGNYWALFSTAGSTNTLYARVDANGTTTNVSLGALPTGFHVYRIQPTPSGFQFSIDGSLKTTIAGTFPSGTALRLVLSAYQASPSPALQADWVRLVSYPSTGTFTSAVFDATQAAVWGLASWTATVPTGTTLTVQTRSGNTATPDSTWSAWTTVTNGGTIASPSARYLQYRVVFTTTDPTLTPVLFDITFTWN